VSMTEFNYERIALWLDGDPIELTAEERAAADEIRRDELLLDSPIDAADQRRAVDRAANVMRAALARPRRRKRYLGILTAAEAVAVAAVLILFWTVQFSGPDSEIDWPDVYVVAAAEIDTFDELDLFQDELNSIRTDLAAENWDATGDQDVDSLEEEIEEFMFFEPVDIWTEG
jgi:hypothetical protein